MLQSGLRPYPVYTTLLTGKNIPPHLGYRPKIPRGVLELLEKHKQREVTPEAVCSKIIQTMFRDSEAQTDPYEVYIEEGVNKGLEILTLGWLSWNNGLPAGMTEINIIERARQKRAWEAALPLPFDKFSLHLRSMIVQAVEINEWNYREELIAAVGELRMELAEKLMKENKEKRKATYEAKIAQYIQLKKEEKDKKIHRLKTSFNRQIRKLTFDRVNGSRKYHRSNIIKQFADKTSELYAPLMRNGVDPRNAHEKINPKFETTLAFQKLAIMHQTDEDIPVTPKTNFDYNKQSKPRGRATELCIRSTKWTEQNLEKLYEQLRNIRRKRLVSPKPLYLKKKVEAQEPEMETPFVEGISDEEERITMACLFLQKTIKGRAIQSVMFEGRVKYQELIEELKSTHALQHEMEDVKAEMRKRVYDMQREAEIEQMRERRKNEILCTLEGRTTGDLLDFLSKELLRLQDERKIHALALAADQERHKREAAEAGRRQVEEQRRREHDEMFKQIVKMHQNTVQAFLEDVANTNRNWMSNWTAREQVTKLAKQIDQAAAQGVDRSKEAMQEYEIIADLIHNFALPEVEKRLVRKRLKDKQRNYLRVCHDEVYMNIEKVVTGPRDERGKLIPRPKVGKHKIPPLIRIKYINLKRMHDSSSSTPETISQQSITSVTDEQFIGRKKHDEERKNMEKEQTDQPNRPKEKQAEGEEQPPQSEKFSSGFSHEGVVLKN